MSKDRVFVDNDSRLGIEGPDAINDCVERLFMACRHSLRVRAPRLDADFYFSESFTECCKSLIKRDLQNELCFLVEDEQFVIKVNSRLITLARQFSSYVRIRVIPKEYVDKHEMFVVCDDQGYMHQPNVEQARGFLDTSDRGMTAQFAARFREVWERSAPPAELFTTGL